ncbi:Major Facilitator Superfamily protein [Sulfitobacter sp. THAF37]|uniref:MFS transporter n=1 Tax=Sulfitobacter sp. THAF37 TaxID=2587855 RepID=UPI001267E24F|nr:MFS transporter [Sulfitobacter sp. THAF37]QFT59721.1 Major Facilitator Superfamily protein [Sulfitobacter sp. THAF37]
MIDDSRAKRNVTILVLAQALLGAQMPMLFVVGGLAGQSLASNVCFATLPISMIVLGSMLSATPVSAIMQRFGRRAGFFLGTAGGALGGAVGAYGLYVASFPIFLVGSLLTGIYMSAQGFYRFAAADTASDDFRPRAISYVMAGGLISAVIGPQIVKWTADAYVIPFLGTYVAAIGVNVVGSLLFLFIDIPKPPVPAQDAPRGRSRLDLIRTPRIAVAVICATVSYALMNLVMTSTPLAVVGCGLSGDLLGPGATAGMTETERLKSFLDIASNVVTGHVLAMFAPSFFTGHLIGRFGVERIMGLGILILGIAGVVALQGVALENFYIALVLLGLGWNFGFIGATTMLAGAHAPHERGRMQGLNDLIVFGGVTMASLASGGLMNCSGGSPAEGWAAVNWAMIPFLVLAGGSLTWLVIRRGTQATA